ncbi:MAG: cation transporter [Candidatus Methanoliparum thermophilum]|uniref:Cation transporter n=1 Tax=Methanoliparum thermophilum TaxID=2491083 RepID=A0A520KRA8_METT2|nr:MAG: cation transporter [Candidatus Methanoliparum thermophilum]
MRSKKKRDEGIFSFYLGIFGNIALFIFKFIIGIFSGSIALISDSFHSLSDFLSTIIAYVGYITSIRPADKSHPYGHEKAESIAGFIVALFLLGLGILLAYNSIKNITTEQPKSIALFAVAVSIVSKEIMARYCFYIADKLNSPAIKAAAYEHRSDALSSIVAFVGVLGAILGIYFLDSVAGFILAVMIFYYGIKVCRENVNILMDKSPSQEIIDLVNNEIKNIPGVLGVHRLRARRMGRNFIIDMHIDVDPSISLITAHKISHAVEKKLEDSGRIASVIVHVCPSGIKIGEED